MVFPDRLLQRHCEGVQACPEYVRSQISFPHHNLIYSQSLRLLGCA